MADPQKPKADSPDATLVDALEDSVAPTGPDHLAISTVPVTAPAAAPVGKRPTGEHAALSPRRVTGKRARPSAAHPAQPATAPVRALDEPATAVTTAPTGPVRALTEPEASVTPGPTTLPNPMPAAELYEPDTRIKPNALMGLGPSGTLDNPPTDSNPAVNLQANTLGDSSGSHPPPPSQSNDPSATHDLKRNGPSRTFAGLDEDQFRRALYGLAGGAALVLVLAGVWAVVKFDDTPADPSGLKSIPHEKAARARDAAPQIEVPKAVMIEQVVDAGNGQTRTVLAAAGTVRIVTDPDANVFIDGRDLGVAPVLVTLPAGKNSVVLENKKLAFKRTVSVDVSANEQTAIRFAFSKGWLELDAPRGSAVTVDGKPVTGTQVQVWEGTHKVEVQHPDKHKTHELQTAEVKAGMTTSVHFEAPSIADE